MEVFKCTCGYTWILSTGSTIPEFILGPIMLPDGVGAMYEIRRLDPITAHVWGENYSDCAYRWLKQKFGAK